MGCYGNVALSWITALKINRKHGNADYSFYEQGEERFNGDVY